MALLRKHVAACAIVCSLLQAQQSQPTIRVTTRLVQVNVVVHDKKDEPVSGLTKDDFAIFEKGKEQKISLFLMDSRRPVAKPPFVLPPNVFSNRVARSVETPTSVTVILIDALNTRFQDQVYAKKQLLRFLQQIQPGDRIALYSLGADLKILHDFTNDPQQLIDRLARYRARISGEVDAAEPDPRDPTGNEDLDQILANSDQTISDFYNVNRARATLSAMEGIANHLAGLPGRKNLIWFSGGFPFTLGLDVDDSPANNPNRERRTFSDETERVSRAMNNANVAIYPVDARGLIAMPSFSADRRTGPIRPGQVFKSSPPNIDTMQILADATGGRAFYNTNDLNSAIRKAVDDALVTYTLGYYTSSEDWDGKFHHIKVEVKRKGLNIRYRKGYQTYQQATPSDKQRDAVLKDVYASPIEATGIGINVRTDPSDDPGKGSLRVIVQITQDNITFEQSNDRWSGAVDLILVQRAEDGRILNQSSQLIDMHLLKPNYDKVMKSGLVLTKYVSADPKAYQLRVIVFDRPTGNVGSIYIPLKGG